MKFRLMSELSRISLLQRTFRDKGTVLTLSDSTEATSQPQVPAERLRHISAPEKLDLLIFLNFN